MADLPAKVYGAGNGSTFRWCLTVTFRLNGTVDVPVLEAWDDFKTNSVLHEIFTGTSVNGNIPMLSGVATTNGSPVSNWKPVAPIPGGATINRLKGSTNYINLSTSFIYENGGAFFNLCWEVPCDATVPADMDCVLILKYSFSGVHPRLEWGYHDSSLGINTEIDVGPNGCKLQPVEAGTGPGNLILYQPMTGVKDNPELWVVESVP